MTMYARLAGKVAWNAFGQRFLSSNDFHGTCSIMSEKRSVSLC
jgi:hypothetical protein